MAFDNSPFRYGAQAPSQAGTQVAFDQGLRTFMLGVYNNMVVGLGISGLVALGLNMAATTATATGRLALTPFGQTLYNSPLKWVLMFAPLAFILVFSMRMDRMSASSARTMFFAFAAVMGASMSTLLPGRPRPHRRDAGGRHAAAGRVRGGVRGDRGRGGIAIRNPRAAGWRRSPPGPGRGCRRG